MYMIAVLALVALAFVSYMWKGREEEEEDTAVAAAGDVYSSRMSTREWFAQRYVPCALDATVIKSIPLVKFSSSQTPNDAEAAMPSNRSSTCAVCLDPFQEDEEMKELPPCQHAFHPSCIDPWFETHSTCPICRAEVTHPSAETGKQWKELASSDKLIHGPTVEIVVG